MLFEFVYMLNSSQLPSWLVTNSFSLFSLHALSHLSPLDSTISCIFLSSSQPPPSREREANIIGLKLKNQQQLKQVAAVPKGLIVYCDYSTFYLT